MINPIELKPFTKFCVSLGMLPSSYKESLTYEEQLMWFCNFLQNEVIPAVNQNAEAVVEMQTLFNELQTYVNNYFSNLDVQEKINNKLDDMTESGELEELIGVYLNANGILTFNTINDMIISDKLVEGSVARTLGGLAFNDMNGHLYKIEHIISANPDGTNLINLEHNDLYARLILEPKVIDDLSSQDEPTKNAPSITSVKNAIDDINEDITELDNSKADSNEVYTKTEIDDKFINNTYDNEADITFAQAGTGRIVRRGNVVIITATIDLEPSNHHTLANYTTLPDWALPSTAINPEGTYNSIRSSVGTDMNIVASGYILVRRTPVPQVALVCYNHSATESATLILTFTYIVD